MKNCFQNECFSMKVLQINVTANWGSTGRIAEEIGEKIISKGGDSYVAYGRHANSSTSHLIRIGTNVDVYMHFVQTRLWDRHGLASVISTRKLIKNIIKIQPDIIHLHNIHGYYLNYLLLFDFLSKYNVPVVWTLHDCWLFTGHCAYYSFAECKRWRTLCYDCPQKEKYPSSLFLDRSKRNFQDKFYAFTSVKNLTLVPVSEWLASEVRQSFLKDYSVRVIHNGIDTDIFTPIQIRKVELGMNDKFVVLGVASVWSSRKGLADFIKLRKMLKDDCLIILIGLNKKQIGNLPKGVIGIERTNSIQELAKYYSVADVFLNPTWEDNFPTTNLEALACGTPVITYCTGGSIEAIDKNTGFIVEQGDLEDVVNKINIIKQSGKDSYVLNCRLRVVEFYDKRSRYDEYMQLYKDLLTVHD